MRTFLLATLIASASAVSAANAESFTFTATATTQNAVSAPMSQGNPVQATFVSGKGETTYTSGRKTNNTFQCANWTSTPGSLFDAYGACNFSEPGGDRATIVLGCDFTNQARTESNCWGALNGLEGPHKGKGGTISWHAKTSPDGTTGDSVGVGQWNE